MIFPSFGGIHIRDLHDHFSEALAPEQPIEMFRRFFKTFNAGFPVLELVAVKPVN
jgi:hypothetical protein